MIVHSSRQASKSCRLTPKLASQRIDRCLASRYFLITPKLLTGLDYNEKMRVLCINNGELHSLRRVWCIADPVFLHVLQATGVSAREGSSPLFCLLTRCPNSSDLIVPDPSKGDRLGDLNGILARFARNRAAAQG
jgi:hypothetical protein